MAKKWHQNSLPPPQEDPRGVAVFVVLRNGRTQPDSDLGQLHSKKPNPPAAATLVSPFAGVRVTEMAPENSTMPLLKSWPLGAFTTLRFVAQLDSLHGGLALERRPPPPAVPQWAIARSRLEKGPVSRSGWLSGTETPAPSRL